MQRVEGSLQKQISSGQAADKFCLVKMPVTIGQITETAGHKDLPQKIPEVRPHLHHDATPMFKS
jgi:hypothetical protein